MMDLWIYKLQCIKKKESMTSGDLDLWNKLIILFLLNLEKVLYILAINQADLISDIGGLCKDSNRHTQIDVRLLYYDIAFVSNC